MPSKTESAKIPVSQRALIARIKRHLEKDGMQLRRSRGRCYVLDVKHNRFVQEFDDIERYARQLELLAKWEELETEN